MKSIIVYYSYSGNTRRLAKALDNFLKTQSETSSIELKVIDAPKNFFQQCNQAFYRKQAILEEASLDFSSYDLVCFGTPVWAFGPAPAMNTCLEKCSGLENKTAILFTTYGSGTGNSRCLNYMQDKLKAKGAANFKRITLPGHKVKNDDFVLSKIKKAFE